MTTLRRLAGGSLLPGLMLYGALATPMFRNALEAVLAGHLLVQLPLLALVGVCVAGSHGASVRRLAPRLAAYNIAGIPGTIVAAATVAFWMLPRSLDAALADPAMEAAKFVTLPLLVGLPLAASWPSLPAVGRTFVGANLLSMLIFLGWLYLTSPVRLCNFYLVDQQTVVGRALLLLVAVLALFWTSRALSGRPSAVSREAALVR